MVFLKKFHCDISGLDCIMLSLFKEDFMLKLLSWVFFLACLPFFPFYFMGGGERESLRTKQISTTNLF
jgi:hypothetical protein